MEICEFLRVKKGLVVLTKIDLVDDPDWLEMVQEDVTEFLKGTFLEGKPIIRVSAATGEGLQELKQALTRLVVAVPPRSSDGPFRPPVDRVFSMRGFGTVVTGTSVAGSCVSAIRSSFIRCSTKPRSGVYRSTTKRFRRSMPASVRPSISRLWNEP